MSRSSLPKQFVELSFTEGSLFQNTLRRLQGLANLQSPLVVCNSDHRFLVAEQLRQLEINDSSILLEPVGRNTAPAVAMAAFSALESDPESLLLVLPADHVIQNKSVFHEALMQAVALAEQDKLVTFGIVPNAPETGYGYIEKGDGAEDNSSYTVARFVEKPNLETAKSYLSSDRFLWNSGMFMFKASRYLQELENLAPDIFESCKNAFEGLEQGDDFQSIPEAIFSQCRSESIDYAVMEKTDSAVVIPLDADWSDLGAWDALWELQQKDSEGNVLNAGEGAVTTEGVSNSFIQAQSRLVAAVGLQDVVIIETADAVLVADKAKAQSVKQIVDQLHSLGREEVNTHRLVKRPWGSYESLTNEDGYKVKHIIVKPGASLSLQMHHHRAEHWTVIKGTALVVCGENEFELMENESTFIPKESKHRLSNTGETDVEIIEVQVGNYLGEDDIVRFEDIYGRMTK
jgi:mannose-1-phosphate guanylyltransferase/mannose-6-phosphate isomerase